MIIVSYYTPGDYEEVMNTHLRPSVEQFNLKHDIVAVEDLGNWQANTSFKAQFCLDMLKKHKEDICFIDSDATIEQLPIALYTIPEGFHIACHLLDWYMMWRNRAGFDKRELLSGTMVLKYCPKTLELVERYVEECKHSTEWEQRILQRIIEEDKSYNLYQLPPQYCAIIKYNGEVPEFMKPTFITHHQASRKFKRR